jgi:mannose-6-phosphate isomerase-like protein (cupin superfamily)
MREWSEKPWGKYAVIHNGNGYQVKILRIDPQGQLSLQRHVRRSEHWVVLAGHVLAQVNYVCTELTVGDQISVPLGALHRLENHNSVPAEIVESQFGDYLGEDDIERLEDRYGRI